MAENLKQIRVSLEIGRILGLAYQHVLNVLVIEIPPIARIPFQTVKLVPFQRLYDWNYISGAGPLDRIEELGMSNVTQDNDDKSPRIEDCPKTSS